MTAAELLRLQRAQRATIINDMTKSNRSVRRTVSTRQAQVPTTKSNRTSRPAPKNRAANKRKPQSRRPWGMFLTIGGVTALFIAVVAFLEITAAGSPAGVGSTKIAPAPASIVSAVTKVPANELGQVGAGAANTPPTPLKSGQRLTSNGKPEVLFIGAEYCPYCALERWALIGAMGRFGTWHHLALIRSSATDPAGPNVPTFTFAHGATYTSKYISFVGREMYTNIPDPSSPAGYTPLQNLSKQQAQLFSNPKLGNNGFPFVDFGGVAAQIGSVSSSPGPTALSNLTWKQVAHDLTQPKSSQAQMILGGINYDTAAICKMTGNRPGAVCDQSIVQKLEARL